MRKGLFVAAGLAVLMAGWFLRLRAADPLKAGDLAPDFTLRDQTGATVRLSDFRGKKAVVLAFYIKAFTPG